MSVNYNVMPDCYSEYSGFHQEVINACNCIEENRARDLSGQIEKVCSSLDKVSLSSWNDSLGESAKSFLEQIKIAINSIIESINSTFIDSENKYLELKDKLDNLKERNERLQEKFSEKPNLEDSKYYLGTETYINNLSQESSYEVRDVVRFNKDMRNWKSAIDSMVTSCNTLIEEINALKEELSGVGTLGIALSSIQFGSLSAPILYSTASFLPISIGIKYLLEMFKSDSEVYTSPFLQRDYKNLKIMYGKTVSSSGCGYCSLAMTISAALSNTLSVPIVIKPDALNEILSKKTGNSISSYYNDKVDYAWNDVTYKDITEAFPVVTVIKIGRNESGIFDMETIGNCLDAGAVIQESLKDRGHIISILKVAERNPNGTVSEVYVGDSGNTKNVMVPCDLSTKFGDGRLAGKEAAIFIPNQNFDIDRNSGVVSGINAKGLAVDSVFICGKKYDAHVEGQNIVIDDVNSLVDNVNTFIKENNDATFYE